MSIAHNIIVKLHAGKVKLFAIIPTCCVCAMHVTKAPDVAKNIIPRAMPTFMVTK